MFPERKIFLRVLLLSIIASVLLMINNLFIVVDHYLVAFELGTLIVSSVFYFLSVKSDKTLRYARLYGALILLILNVSWFQSGGFKGNNSVVIILLLLFFLVIYDNSKRHVILFFFITNVIILFIIEYSFNEEVRKFEYPNHLISHALMLVIVLVLTSFILFKYKKHYLRIHDENQDMISLLKEKNNKIEGQNKIISNQNIQLQQHSIGLEIDLVKQNQKLKEKNAELKRKNKNLEKFASIIAHDLKLPIAQISGLLQIIPVDFTDDFNVQEIIYRLRASTSDLKEIADDLSQVVNVEISDDISLVPVDLSEILDVQLVKLNSYIKQVNAKVDVTKEKELYINALEGYFDNIFFNIIHNAIKFSSQEESPFIDIRLKKEGDNVLFEVKDNGIGFEIGSKKLEIGMYNKNEHSFEGKGYGLYLVKAQLDKVGGEIDIVGENKKGTEVKVSIPIN
ncbi:sensor histidine kinase [Marinigracilibium pacificum]|uniref:histidine kinase n=1 Tax=Marinigracilibium pacificum TaxID=2729599 RepID=A0A848J6T8_9BACT|nr:HAMP domain-containing sensor histidine kinase [Marinigracilibium pacificum]NMM50230.1 HAMP domain-containing histidine kinase [Marinigracilibium pacificum]